MSFTPKYTITQKILENLTKIENMKIAFEDLNISPVLLTSLRNTAKVSSIHYSTKIEGNCLTQKEVEDAIIKHKVIKAKERDSKEVMAYYKAVNYLESYIEKGLPFNEAFIKNLHDLIEGFRSEYRDGQNAIYEASSRHIVYMPPEAKDVPFLMNELVNWVNSDIPIPCVIKAGLVHYQFVTIHPYYDGNGRTARLVTSFLMRKYGYGLKDIYSLEEYYSNDLQRYYAELSTHKHHNYYEGREQADLTGWINYFTEGVAEVFGKIQLKALEIQSTASNTLLMRKLDIAQRKILELFVEFEEVSSMQIAQYLGLSQQSARVLANKWIKNDFLILSNLSKKNRKYKLSDEVVLGTLNK